MPTFKQCLGWSHSFSEINSFLELTAPPFIIFLGCAHKVMINIKPCQLRHKNMLFEKCYRWTHSVFWYFSWHKWHHACFWVFTSYFSSLSIFITDYSLVLFLFNRSRLLDMFSIQPLQDFIHISAGFKGFNCLALDRNVKFPTSSPSWSQVLVNESIAK